MNTANVIPADFGRVQTQVHLSIEEQQAFLDIQHSILQMVAANRPQDEILAELCLMAERLVPDSLATVMLMQDHQSMDIIAAPTVAPDDQLLLNGLKPGPTAGTCGNAVYRNEAMYTSNVHSDERCGQICNVFERFELNSCWSNPVRAADGSSIGSFALSSFENREPSAFHKELLAVGGHIIGIILQRSREQAQLERMAYEDPLTGLANRGALFRELTYLLDVARKESAEVAVVQINIDRFKTLNDHFGHSFGDEILKLIGTRIQGSVQGTSFVARVGGDEFVVLTDTIAHAEETGARIIESLRDPIEYQSYRFPLSCSVGVTYFPGDGDSAEALLKNADTAVYSAKRGEQKLCRYKAELTSESVAAFRIENELRAAIENNALSLKYQAKVNAKTQRVTGYEALLRWDRSEGAPIGPAEFVPVAEKTGLIIPIGEWVVKTALKEALALYKQDPKSFSLAVNISAAQLGSREHIDILLNHISDSPIPNDSIYFEITETVMVREASYAPELLEVIRASGVRLSIDDFGMGYSSLGYLRRFNVSQLKMDKLLVDDVAIDDESLAIAKAVVALGHSLGLEVVAEGVETPEQAAALASLGCNTLQGFYFSRPSPAGSYLEDLTSA